jgi:hypothetical protein
MKVGYEIETWMQSTHAATTLPRSLDPPEKLKKCRKGFRPVSRQKLLHGQLAAVKN